MSHFAGPIHLPGATPADERNGSLSRGTKAIFTLMILIGVPLLAESAVRIRDAVRFGSTSPSEQLYTSHPRLGQVLRPGAELAGASTHVKINSHGFRGPEIESVKPPGTFRVACLGASTTFGTYSSSNEAAWPAQLQSQLSETFSHFDVEVINAGVPGYTVTQSAINFKERVLPLQPDLVVIYHAPNDISYEQRRCSESKAQSAQAVEPMFLVKWLSKNSLLFEKVAKNVQVRRNVGDETKRSNHLPTSASESFRERIEALVDDCRTHRIPVVLCTAATQFRADQPEATQRKAAETALYYNENLSVQGLIRAYRSFNATIQAVAADGNLPCADVFAAVPGESKYFGDSIHFTDLGERIVAGCVHDAIAESGLVPAGPAIADIRR
jgi:lysophospholipase L1-like esterase